VALQNILDVPYDDVGIQFGQRLQWYDDQRIEGVVKDNRPSKVVTM
jgi:hypothetical protein